MVTKEFLVILNRVNVFLPEHVYWAYEDTEIIEISTDIETSIELTNGARINAIDLDIKEIKMRSDCCNSFEKVFGKQIFQSKFGASCLPKK